MDIEGFIQRWQSARGGAERANYQMFLTELCEALDLPRPAPASDDTCANDYVFERGVKRRESEGLASTLRIDLYKRGSFILEAKQSRAAHRPDGQASLFNADETASTAASQGRWDILMRNARRQAEDYVFRLPADHAAPPFIIVCDVGYVFEVYADFSGSGRAYSHFPDRKRFRIQLEDLRDPEVVARLRDIWSDPHSLDPGRHAARVTRQIAERLAQVSKALEKKHPAEEVAQFLMRCIFTMFAEDADLLPRGQFTALLEECLDGPASFAPLLQDLWRKMDAPEYADRFFSGFKTHLRYFNGGLFHDARAFPMGREEIGELLAASRHDWRYVEPAIFGTLVEQALDTKERRKLGAHYTPRAYVERLVEVTVMEPLRGDWADAQLKAGDARERGDLKEAVATIRAFHHQLCNTRVLDPACGTGNFLYVSLELMKKLEGDVLEALAELGQSETIGFETVDPHQFLGIELNVRAAAIAELVLWIGYLQQHFKTRNTELAEPILQAFGNIQQKDAVLTWDGYPELQFEMQDGVAVQVYPNARRPDWPEAEFIVGNPPFITASDFRNEFGSPYAETIWRAHPHINGSADFVMYWWDRAAELLARKKSQIRRFGFVTTNSISQVFLRRVVERHLSAKPGVSIIFAVPDHPWIKGTPGAAAVRIAMTVAAQGRDEGVLSEVVAEAGLDSDDPKLDFKVLRGRINSDLSVGADVTTAAKLRAGAGIAHDGVKLHGAGFILRQGEAEHLGLGTRPGLERYIRPYRNGRDLTAYSRNLKVIDLFGVSADETRRWYPEVYQHLLEKVKPERDRNNRASYRDNWWIFGEPRRDLRPALAGIERLIATVDTARHRLFQFVASNVVLDDKSVVITHDDGATLSTLSSRIHVTWAVRAGGWSVRATTPSIRNPAPSTPSPSPTRPTPFASPFATLAKSSTPRARPFRPSIPI